MAGNHILISYKIFDAISGGTFSEEESWQFIKAMVNYDRCGELPDFPPSEASVLWTVIRPELDSYKKNWTEKAQRRSKAGKKGGSSTSEKKGTAARKNGHLGGAPLGNKNANKTTQAENENLNKNNSFGGNT